MCGYACIGCGNCGKQRAYELVLVCRKCQTTNEPGAAVCVACGFPFAPPPGVAAGVTALSGGVAGGKAIA